MIKTSEAVLRGHPDKVCDQIADFILTKLVQEDKDARAAIECLIKNELLVIAGEVSTTAKINYTNIAKECLSDIGLNSKDFEVREKISLQSNDIAIGVNKGGAGDQGIMYGYAENTANEFLPLPVILSRKLAANLDELNRKYSEIYDLDGKCQVSIRYEGNLPKEVTCIVVSIQTKQNVKRAEYTPQIYKMIYKSIPKELITHNTEFLINPTGEFVKGGSFADSGLTGRKLQCDSYGGLALHGGGAWSGKDLTKVDRSASYYARYIAKNIVGANLASKCEIGIAYAIGIEEPISVSVNTFGTGKQSDENLLQIIHKVFDFKPSIIKEEMRVGNYYHLSMYGHVGVMVDELPWEKLNRVHKLQEFLHGKI